MSHRRLLCALVLPFLCWAGVVHGQTPNRSERALKTIREYALKYTKSLPDFTCVRVTQQSIGYNQQMKVPPRLANPFINVVEEELTVSGAQETYRILKVDKNIPEHLLKPPPDLILRRISIGEFGRSLERIFGAETGTRFEWNRSGKLRGRPVAVLTFDVPRAHGVLVYDRLAKQDLMVGYHGLVYADAQTNAVLRVEMQSSDFPSESEFTRMELTFDYNAVKLGEHEVILPHRFTLDLHSRILSGTVSTIELAQESSVQAEYKKYSSAQSVITYDAGAQGDVHSIITFGTAAAPVP